MGDLHGDRTRFEQGFPTRRLAHPRALPKPFSECPAHGLNHLEHAGPRLRRKVLAHEELTDSINKVLIDHPDASLPARWQRSQAANAPAIEIEVGRYELRRQRIDRAADQMSEQERAPGGPIR